MGHFCLIFSMLHMMMVSSLENLKVASRAIYLEYDGEGGQE